MGNDHRGGLGGQQLADGVQHLAPVGVGHFQTVLVHHVGGANLGIGQSQQAEVAFNFAIGVAHGSSLFGVDLFNRAAGGDQVDQLHYGSNFRKTATSTLPTTSRLWALSLSSVS